MCYQPDTVENVAQKLRVRNRFVLRHEKMFTDRTSTALVDFVRCAMYEDCAARGGLESFINRYLSNERNVQQPAV